MIFTFCMCIDCHAHARIGLSNLLQKLYQWTDRLCGLVDSNLGYWHFCWNGWCCTGYSFWSVILCSELLRNTSLFKINIVFVWSGIELCNAYTIWWEIYGNKMCSPSSGRHDWQWVGREEHGDRGVCVHFFNWSSHCLSVNVFGYVCVTVLWGLGKGRVSFSV